MFAVVFLLPLSLLASLVSGETITAENLKAITTNSKLPNPKGFNSVVYDGQDSIYVLGGDSNRQIIKYTAAKDQVEAVGQMLDNWSVETAVWGENGNIFYIGGRDSFDQNSEVWGLNVDNPRNISRLSPLPEHIIWTTSVWDGGDKIYVIGGHTGSRPLNTIVLYSVESRQAKTTAFLPLSRYGATVVWDANNKVVYIFGGHRYNGYSSDILKFDPVQGTVTKLNATLPTPLAFSCSVWTGTEAYIIGGYNDNATNWSPISRFNPSTNEVVEIAVNNFPEKLYGFGCAYVVKLNRIYILGGSNGGNYRDEIMYVDLGPKFFSNATQEASYDTGTPNTMQASIPTASKTTHGGASEDQHLSAL